MAALSRAVVNQDRVQVVWNVAVVSESSADLVLFLLDLCLEIPLFLLNGGLVGC